MYGVYDMAGGRAEYISAYLGSWAPARFGNIYNIVTANLKYKQISKIIQLKRCIIFVCTII